MDTSNIRWRNGPLRRTRWLSSLTLAIGIPLAVYYGTGGKVGVGIITTILDLMQTMPTFVYLGPIVLFFGIGASAAVALLAAVVARLRTIHRTDPGAGRPPPFLPCRAGRRVFPPAARLVGPPPPLLPGSDFQVFLSPRHPGAPSLAEHPPRLVVVYTPRGSGSGSNRRLRPRISPPAMALNRSAAT